MLRHGIAFTKDGENYIVDQHAIGLENLSIPTRLLGNKITTKEFVYEETEEDVESGEFVGLTFGQAIQLLKADKAVTRAGWNGKDMFVYLVPYGDYTPTSVVGKQAFKEVAHYNPYLAIKTVTGSISTWAPSVGDVLAEDWGIAVIK